MSGELIEQPRDDLDDLIDEMCQDPATAAAYRDVQERSALVLALVRARADSGRLAVDVGRDIAAWVGVSNRKALRMVRDYETGRLGSDAPMWFVQAYARAIGARVRLEIEPPPGLYERTDTP